MRHFCVQFCFFVPPAPMVMGTQQEFLEQIMFYESSALDPIRPLFPRMILWWLWALRDYHEKFTLEEQLELGSIHRANYIQPKALGYMRKDEATAGRFRPGDSKGRGFLLFEGDTASIAVLLRKVNTLDNGRLATSRNGTGQEGDVLDGMLPLIGSTVLPLVCGYQMQSFADGSCDMNRILLGSECRTGLEWQHTMWRRDADDDQGTGQVVAPEPPMPLFPPTKIVLLKPIPAEAPDITAIGTEVARIKQRAEERRIEEERKRRSGRA